MDSPLGEPAKKKKIRELLDLVWREADSLSPAEYLCCINTELNSTNFLMNSGDESGDEGGDGQTISLTGRSRFSGSRPRTWDTSWLPPPPSGRPM